MFSSLIYLRTNSSTFITTCLYLGYQEFNCDTQEQYAVDTQDQYAVDTQEQYRVMGLSQLTSSKIGRPMMCDAPFACLNNCGRKYKYKGNMMVHFKYECGKEPQFKCSLCEKKFTHRASLRNHMGVTHRIIM